MWVPRTLRGGLELDPVASLEVIENVSYGDPSAGWVLMAASLAIGTGAAYLKDDAVKELFSGARFPVIAGQGIAICSDVLVARELATGVLVKALNLALPGYGFYLVHTPDHPRQRTIKAFSSWLRSVR